MVDGWMADDLQMCAKSPRICILYHPYSFCTTNCIILSHTTQQEVWCLVSSTIWRRVTGRQCIWHTISQRGLGSSMELVMHLVSVDLNSFCEPWPSLAILQHHQQQSKLYIHFAYSSHSKTVDLAGSVTAGNPQLPFQYIYIYMWLCFLICFDSNYNEGFQIVTE